MFFLLLCIYLLIDFCFLAVFEELPLAPPPPPRQFTESELKNMRRQEESVMRELRIFLRDIALRLFRDRKFAVFAKPVDLEEVCF